MKSTQDKRLSRFNKGSVAIPCSVCGKEVKRFASQILKKVFCPDCTTKRIDLTGKVFGELTVIERTSKRIKRGQNTLRWLWLCKCSCGKILEVPQDQLKSGQSKTCGDRAIHRSGGNCHNFIGGKDAVHFDGYSGKLNFAEETRRDIINHKVLQVKCVYCGQWFVPTRTQVESRLSCLLGRKGRTAGECRFYCSEGCKSACSTYKVKLYPKGFKKATSREVDPELCKMVFERDGWQCQICDSGESLHCHHIEGYTQNKMLSHDMDNCITLCKKHHKWVHTKEGCKYYDLRCKESDLPLAVNQ